MVGARAPGTEQISQQKRRKMAFFEGCPVGWGRGVPTGAGLVDGGLDQGPWLQERVQARVREGLAWRSGGVQGLRLRGGRW